MTEQITDGTGESQKGWKIDSDNAGYVKVVDDDGNVLDLEASSEGNKKSLNVTDTETQIVLNQILKELKKLNLNISILSDNYIKNEDVE